MFVGNKTCICYNIYYICYNMSEKKDDYIRIRVSKDRKKHWIGFAEGTKRTLSELVHDAMKKESGMSPFDLQQMIERNKEKRK